MALWLYLLVQTYKRPMWPAVTVEPESCEAGSRRALLLPLPLPLPLTLTLALTLTEGCEADSRWACDPKTRLSP